VAMPLGSSSAAPVMTPGPNFFHQGSRRLGAIWASDTNSLSFRACACGILHLWLLLNSRIDETPTRPDKGPEVPQRCTLERAKAIGVLTEARLGRRRRVVHQPI